MNHTHAMVAMTLAAGAAAGPPVMAAPSDPESPLAQMAEPLPLSEQAIRDAANPSAAIEAYASAPAATSDRLSLERAYVARMVDFGLPEMAYVQAQDLLQRDPENALAWGVTAYMNAKRGQLPTALSNVANAAKRSPDDPFIQQTAGQIVAWYDTRVDRAHVTNTEKQSVETIRTDLAGRPVYAETYRTARETYQSENPSSPIGQQTPSTSPATAGTGGPQPYPTTAPTSAPMPSLAPPDTSTPSSSNTYYAPYPDTVVYGGPYYYSSWPGPWVWWWPSFSSVIIVNHDFHHHHDHDDFHHHGDFLHDGFRHDFSHSGFADPGLVHDRFPDHAAAGGRFMTSHATPAAFRAPAMRPIDRPGTPGRALTRAPTTPSPGVAVPRSSARAPIMAAPASPVPHTFAGHSAPMPGFHGAMMSTGGHGGGHR